MIEHIRTQIEARMTEHAATIEAYNREIIQLEQAIAAASVEAENAIRNGDSDAFAKAQERISFAEKRLAHLKTVTAAAVYSEKEAAAIAADLQRAKAKELSPLYHRVNEHLAAGDQLHRDIDAIYKKHGAAVALLSKASSDHVSAPIFPAAPQSVKEALIPAASVMYNVRIIIDGSKKMTGE